MTATLQSPETYGSDKDGLVCGFAFAPQQAGIPVGADAAAERWLQQQLELPEAFLDSLRGDSGSTRVEQAGDWLVAVLNDVLFDFALETAQVSALCVCVDRRLMLSARAKPLRSIDRLRASVKEGEVLRFPAELLAHLLRDQADVMVQIVRDSTRRVDSIEDRLLSSRVGSSRSQLGGLRRVLVRLQRLLAPEPAALFRLL